MTQESYISVLRATLDSAKRKEYAGYSKFDALNSPLLALISKKSAWLRFAFIQMVKVSPINLRPIFGVKISPNPKGITLFARAYLSLYEATGDKNCLDEAEKLLRWLIEHRIPDQEYFCWGYNYTWQDIPPFIQHEGEPISIVTIFGGETFMHAYEVTKKQEYLDIARSASDFLTKKLATLHETDDELAVAYTVNNEKTIVINIQALTAALLAKVWKHTKDGESLEKARKMVNFVLKCKTPYDAWFYTYPARDSHIKHDNYHTGGVVDALLEYADITEDARVMEVYWKGLEYYAKNLFEPSGAPRWMNDRGYPYDVHGAAQGIVSFSKAAKFKKEYGDIARRIADWSVANLYREETGDFRYRKGRFFDYDFSLMHWCNGWMARGLGELINIK